MNEEIKHIADLLETVEVRGQHNLTVLLACINSLRIFAAENDAATKKEGNDDAAED